MHLNFALHIIPPNPPTHIVYMSAHLSHFGTIYTCLFHSAVNPCELDPCYNNATCVNPGFGKFVCVCPNEWAGAVCDIGRNDRFYFGMHLDTQYCFVFVFVFLARNL